MPDVMWREFLKTLGSVWAVLGFFNPRIKGFRLVPLGFGFLSSGPSELNWLMAGLFSRHIGESF